MMHSSASGKHPMGAAGTDAYQAIVAGRRANLAERLSAAIPPGARFVWEIGSGHGHFLTAYAQAQPGKLCVGIDIVSERVERANRKRDRAKLTNLHFNRADARLFVETIPAEARCDEIFVLFPDPWPKLRHHKHRIMQPEFLHLVADCAAPDCRLYFRTDFQPYYRSTLAMLGAHRRWEPVDEPWPFEFETVFQQRAQSHASIVARLRP